MHLTIRNVDQYTKLRLNTEPVATIQIEGRTALFEFEGRKYEIELGLEIAKALDLL